MDVEPVMTTPARRWIALLAGLAVACGPAPTALAPTTPAESRAPATATATVSAPTVTAAPTPTASEPAQAAPTPAPVVLPGCAGAADVEVFALCVPGARVDIDRAIGERDAALIVAQVRDDLAAVQREFERTLRSTPWIDVYATPERYAAGLRAVFGYSRATADFLAENSVAFFEPSLGRIAVSWEAIRDRRPIAAIRHELTHAVTLEACAPRCDLVPAWLNEGEARLAEALLPGADWRLLRVRYEAASMVATGTLIPLGSLWSQVQWNAIADWAGYYKYQQAARAVELLRADIGDRAIARLYARIRMGEDVPSAYERLSGRTWSAFVSGLADRFASAVPVGPGIALAAPGADGRGASYLLYGFPAEAPVTLHLRSRHLEETQQLTVSPQGAHFGSLDDSYPPGAYAITATSATATVTVDVQKRGGRVRARTPEAAD